MDGGEGFEDRFRRLSGPMLRALERRRDRALARGAALDPARLGRPLTGGEATERERWFNLERDYQQACDGVHAASVFVHHAGVLLRKIRDDAKEQG